MSFPEHGASKFNRNLINVCYNTRRHTPDGNDAACRRSEHLTCDRKYCPLRKRNALRGRNVLVKAGGIHCYHYSMPFFYICSSVYRNSRLKTSNKMQQYADIYLRHKIHKTVVAASGTDHTVWGASLLSSCLVTFEEACSPDSMICTRGCTYSFVYS